MKQIRVRFAPSPTGGLHIGGVRTLVYNYLFAKKHAGKLILRIEDTDRSRFVDTAEQYITETANWLGITFDESPQKGGEFGPYRQSERLPIYRQHVQQLIRSGRAYYAFDTPEELAELRHRKTMNGRAWQYDAVTRMYMKNSLSLGEAKTQELLARNTPHVVRLNVPPEMEFLCPDLLRGNVVVPADMVDDKVLLKADGTPTYHLAAVVDDHLMRITHVLRGEEWLPSFAAHMLLWRFFEWEHERPVFVHLPLILKPQGQGKLSKRDAEQLSVPVFPLAWTDPHDQTYNRGFREEGFLPEALVNFLATLSWTTPSDEVTSTPDLIAAFSLEKVHHNGVRFDFDKAKWMNRQHLRLRPPVFFVPVLQACLRERSLPAPEESVLLDIIAHTQDRYETLQDVWAQTWYFFMAPSQVDVALLADKSSAQTLQLFTRFLAEPLERDVEEYLCEQARHHNLKIGNLQLMLRIMLTGAKMGVGVFFIARVIGAQQLRLRIDTALRALQKNPA